MHKYDFSHVWDIKLKTANKQTKQTKTCRHRQWYGGYQRGRGTGKGEGVKYMVTERRFDFRW